MSAIIESYNAWLNAEFWDHLLRIEGHHQRVHSDYDSARRQLDRLDPKADPAFQDAWTRYCEVVAELDRATGELEFLRLRGV